MTSINNTIAMQDSRQVEFTHVSSAVFTINRLADFQRVLGRILAETSELDYSEYFPTARLLFALLDPANNEKDALKAGYNLASGPTPGCCCDVCEHAERREIGLVCLEKPAVWSWYLQAVDRFLNKYWHISADETSWILCNRWAHEESDYAKRALEQLLKVVYASQFKPVHSGRAIAESMIAGYQECFLADDGDLCAQCRESVKVATWYLMITEGAIDRDPEFA